MSRQTPTLKGLRAFEEVYLCGSYTKAAKALNVQQPAISYQIKRLEEDLETTLFEKAQGRLAPTLHAHELYDTVSRAFGSIRKTADKLRQADKLPTISIATYPGIGTYWLSPRLPNLSENLGVRTKVVTLVKNDDLLREEVDCWIVFGKGVWPGFDAKLLIQEEVCPVASPVVAQQISAAGGNIVPEGIALIEQEDPENRWLSWDAWQDQAQGNWQLPDKRIVVNDHGLALHLALTGAGLALGWVGIIQDLIKGQSLVQLSPDLVTSKSGYWLLGPRGFFETVEGQRIFDVLTGHHQVDGQD
ncbi:LysR family transcriptional regulator [Roseovarius sp. EL26]|uniref:LysR family transcriptional regulator n=1 Tax=Roseovarius sp. EL26 TaxID=2126672 RepID=UPI000EA09B5C|nr:LysR family transcriptional regulator [Roseovarius sp. EL26]